MEFWHRSLARSRTIIGFRNYVNPVLIENSVFVSFQDTAAQVSLGVRAVSFRSVRTGASNISFMNTPLTGRVLENKLPAREFVYRDYTGSISTFQDSYLVHNFSHLTSAKCEQFPEWGSMSVCPHKYVSFSKGKMANISLMRSDQPGAVYIPQDNENKVFLSTGWFAVWLVMGGHRGVFCWAVGLPRLDN